MSGERSGRLAGVVSFAIFVSLLGFFTFFSIELLGFFTFFSIKTFSNQINQDQNSITIDVPSGEETDAPVAVRYKTLIFEAQKNSSSSSRRSGKQNQYLSSFPENNVTLEENVNSKPLFTKNRSSSSQLRLKNICDLKSNKPDPVILMSLGRSGTASTWQVMSVLTGEQTWAKEYTGGNSEKSKQFFTEQIPKEIGGNWIFSLLCLEQKRHPNAGIVGFRWKPFKSIHLPLAKKGLQKAAASNRTVRIVRSRRNILDVIMSRYKHDTGSIHVKAHCRVDDKGCLEGHSKRLTLPTARLVKDITDIDKLENRTDALLDELGVSHISVSYDKLYFSGDAEEWMRIFLFLGVGPGEGLSVSRVRRVMDYVSTSVRSHNESLANYEEVREALMGSGYENLIH